MPKMLFSICLAYFLLFAVRIIGAKKPHGTPAWPPIVTSARGFTHEAVYNGTGSVAYYSFNGIKYGRLIERFAAPAPICRKSFLRKCPDPNPSISMLADSAKLRRGYPKCAQAIPDWVHFQNETYIQKELMTIPDDEVEDCLFLDVIVPKQVWDQTHDHSAQSFAPVFVWIHGGGFTSGSRDFHDDPSVLLAKCLEIQREGVIIVTINYRLGLFGFLASEGADADSNVGLLDQRLALGWIEKYISNFGGDPSHITVVGEGTGAGSILHHLTAPNMSSKFFPKLHDMSHWYQRLPFHKWQRNFPFQSAILHCPTLQPMIPFRLRVLVDQILLLAGRVVNQPLTRISELRDLPYETLYAVNHAMVRESPYGTFTFGPSADYAKGHRSYVPDTPLRRLKAGEMASSVNVFVGCRRNEGRYLTPSSTNTDLGFQDHLAKIFPTLAQSEITYMSTSLYPILDYESMAQGAMNRSIQALNDLYISCNVHYLLVYMLQSYGYFLETSPANGEQFLEQTLMKGGATPGIDAKTQKLTNWLANTFVRFGLFASLDTKKTGVRPYNGNAKVLLATEDGFKGYVNDPTARSRCHYWANTPF